jgi:hypothetical protein
MSIHSIPRNRRKRKTWHSHLSQQRRIDSYNVSIEIVRIEARMKARPQLTPQAWAEMEARWQALPDLDACMPEQRRDFLLHEEAAMDEARENARQEIFLQLIHETSLSDDGARRHIAHLEHLAEVRA